MKRMSVSCSPNASKLLGSAILLSLLVVASTSSADGPAKSLATEPCASQAGRYTVAPSGSTLTALAACHEHEGKTASAWAEYLEASTMAQHERRADVAASAKQRAGALEPKLSTLAVRVPPGWDLPGIDVKRDGITLVRAAWGTAAPVDPGEHRIEVTAPGKRPFHRTIVVRPGSIAVTVEVGPLEDEPSTAVGTTSLTAASVPGEDKSDSRPGSTQRGLGLAIGAVGLASLGVGTFFGIRALDKSDAARAACPSSPCADHDAVQTNQQAKDAATVSTISLAAGGGLFLLGSILFFTAPSKAPAASHAAPAPQKPKVDVAASSGYAGLRVGGEF